MSFCFVLLHVVILTLLEKRPFAIPSQLQIDWISKCIGGHLDDLDHAIVAMTRY
jgi:hypothetical protein